MQDRPLSRVDRFADDGDSVLALEPAAQSRPQGARGRRRSVTLIIRPASANSSVARVPPEASGASSSAPPKRAAMLSAERQSRGRCPRRSAASPARPTPSSSTTRRHERVDRAAVTWTCEAGPAADGVRETRLRRIDAERLRRKRQRRLEFAVIVDLG